MNTDTRERDRILDLLHRTHDGDAWHGPSVMSALDGVTADAAAAHPIAGGHSIWEIVLHMIGWRLEVARRLQGGAAAEPAGGDWPHPPETTLAAWTDTLEALQAAHETLVHTVARVDPAILDAPVVDRRDPALGSGVSHYVTLHGIVQHDLYHAGQISLLKRAVESA